VGYQKQFETAGIEGLMDDTVVLLVGPQTCDSQIVNSSSGWVPSYFHLIASVTKQYNLVLAKGQ